MKKLLLYLLLLPALAFGQIKKQQVFYQLANSAAPYEFTYTDIPDAPSTGTSATLTYSAPGNILNSTGGTTQNKYLSGAWTEFHAFSFVGTAGAYQRIINLNGSTVIGSVANHLFTREGTNSTYFGIYGLSAAAPLYFDEVGGVDATSAIQLSAFATGPNVVVQNIVNNSRGYGIFANSAGTLSGGNSSTVPSSANNYGSINISFSRTFSPAGNKENDYMGATTTSTYAKHTDLDMSHMLGYNAEWDGVQIQNATDFTLTKSTYVNNGTDNTASQNASVQIQNSYGVVEDCIFMDAPQGFRFATHNLYFRNNYVRWTGNTANQAISYYGNYAATDRLMVVVDTVFIEDNDFVATTWTGALIDVLDPNAIYVLRNNRIEGPTSLFQDSRGGSPTGSLVDGGGNTFVTSTVETPTFSNFTPTDFTGHGLVTEQTNHQKGRGFRSPN